MDYIVTMEQPARHQCLIYKGSPAIHLTALSLLAQMKLGENYRCLYLNGPSMVAGMRSYLAARNIDVAHEISKGSLVLSSDQGHLVDGVFDVDRMMRTLEDAVGQALSDGYKGLWATGDMSWEFGPKKDFRKLLAYEVRLEAYFHKQPALCGICQYHADTLPEEALQHGLRTHQSIFVNETLSRLNTEYVPTDSFKD